MELNCILKHSDRLLFGVRLWIDFQFWAAQVARKLKDKGNLLGKQLTRSVKLLTSCSSSNINGRLLPYNVGVQFSYEEVEVC